MECYVCCLPIEKDAIFCIVKCTAAICSDCLQRYIEFSAKENTLPKCSCGTEYHYNTFRKKIPREIFELYLDCCVAVAKLRFSTDLRENAQNQQILKAFINERKDYFDSVPNGIRFILTNALKPKMKTIQQAILETRSKLDSFKKCRNIVCVGVMESDDGVDVCNTCYSVFCTKCEEERHTHKKHECKPDDLKSILLKNSMISCPTCFVKITKIDGCEFMTCSICKTNFHYTSGEKTLYGSHKATENHKQKKDGLLRISCKPEIMTVLLQIDELNPPIKKPTGSILEQGPFKITKALTKELVCHYGRIKYFRVAKNIYNASVTKDGLTLELVETSLKILQDFFMF